jgi:type IV secretory pathway VirB2 component (pilin)
MKTSSDLNPSPTLFDELTKSAVARCIFGVLISSAVFFLTMMAPVLVFGSVESSLSAVQDKLVGTLLPLAAILGLGIAGLSFVAGHPNAKSHFIYAIIGAIVGFGAESIVSFIRDLIH